MTGLRRSWWLPVIAALAACHSDSTAPQTLTVSSSSVAFGTRGRVVTLHAAVLGQAGDTVQGRTFTWATSNASVVAVTLSAGDSAMLFSTGAGSATVTLSSGGLQKTINVSVKLVIASSIDSGNMQVASAGLRLDAPLVLIVKDSLGSPARGDTVAFAVSSGGGSVTTASAIADLNGRVATNWTLGTSGTQAVTATAPGLSFTFNAAMVPASNNTTTFNIIVVDVGSPFSPAVQAAFDSAAAFWGRAITGDLASDSLGKIPEGNNGCGDGFPAVGPLKVDDVVIMAIIRPIDGPGGILGGAGPCFVRVTNAGVIAPTLIGAMEFDSADVPTYVANGQFASIVKHEMAHVLGFGTFWQGGNLGGVTGIGCLQLPTSSAPGPDTYYNCPQGLAYFDSIGGASYTGGNVVPVENCGAGSPAGCGQGTWNSHWRETVFGTELMTGYLQANVPNPVSKMTIAQFADLGYTGVDVTKAEPYTQVFTAPSAFRLIAEGVSLANDARMPIFAKARGARPVRIGWAPVR